MNRILHCPRPVSRQAPVLSTGLYWLAVFALQLLFSQTVAAGLQQPPLWIGSWTNFGFPDPTVQENVRPVADGVRAAVKAINAEGGINGRELAVIECEGSFTPSKYVACLNNTFTLSNYSVVATLGLLVSQTITAVQPVLVEKNIFTVQSQGIRTFNRHWTYLRASDHAILTSMIRHIVYDLHFRRVGLIWAPDQGLNGHLLPEAEALCVSLGINFTGTLAVNFSQFTFLKTQKQVYHNFLAGRPQAIIFLGSSVSSNKDVMIDLMRKSASGNSTVPVAPELTILTWEGAGQIFQATAKQLVKDGYPECTKRLRLVTGLPHLLDLRYEAAKHAYRDFVSYFGNESFASLAAEYSVNAMSFWTQTRFIANVLRQLQPSNISSASFMDKVFSSSVITVDDLTFGMFAESCTGMRAAAGFFCQCNEGYRTVETYYLTESFQLAPVAGGAVTTSFGECGNVTAVVVPPLVYLLVAPADSSTTSGSSSSSGVSFSSVARSLLQGAQALSASMHENCTVPSGANESLVVQQMIDERQVSVIFPALVDAGAVLSDMAIVDPFYFPVQLAPEAFDRRTIHIMATLQQEIHALASAAVVSADKPSSPAGGSPSGAGVPSGAGGAPGTGGSPPGGPSTVPAVTAYVAVVKGKTPTATAAMIAAITKSLNTFGVSLTGSSQLLASDSLDITSSGSVLPAAPFTGFLFLIGVVTSAADVHDLVVFLAANPEAVAMLAFNEVCVLYDVLMTEAQKAHVDDRIQFATSLTNWNRMSQLSATSSSPLMQSFFDTFPDPSMRTPLTLRGFVVNAAVRTVAELVSPSLISSDAFLSKWYSIAVIAAGADVVLGAYSDAPCSSAGEGSSSSNRRGSGVTVRATCETNTGARVVNVFSLRNVAPPRPDGPSDVPLQLSSFQFSSGAVDYQPLPAGPSSSQQVLSSQTLVGICVGVAVFIVLLAAFNKLRKSPRFEQLVVTGLWRVCMQVAVRIGSLVVDIASTVSIVGVSSSVTFTTFYLILTSIGGLSIIYEVSILVTYFNALVESSDDLPEDVMMSWEMRIATAALLSLGLKEMPIVVMSFVALLKLPMSLIVLLSFAISCFFAGMKARFLKEVFSTVIRKIKVRRSRRFTTLRQVARFVVMLLRTTGPFSKTAETMRGKEQRQPLSYASTAAEIIAVRTTLFSSNPMRFREVRKRAKYAAIDLKKADVDADEYFAVVQPYLARDFFTPSTSIAAANNTPTCVEMLEMPSSFIKHDFDGVSFVVGEGIANPLALHGLDGGGGGNNNTNTSSGHMTPGLVEDISPARSPTSGAAHH